MCEVTSYSVTLVSQAGVFDSYQVFGFSENGTLVGTGSNSLASTLNENGIEPLLPYSSFTTEIGSWKYTKDSCGDDSKTHWKATLLDFNGTPVVSGPPTGQTGKVTIRNGRFSDDHSKIKGTLTFTLYNNPGEALADSDNVAGLFPAATFKFKGRRIEA